MSAETAATVDLIAGKLCLDFANTIEPRIESRHGGHPRDYLTNYGAVIDWSLHAGILTEEQAYQLLQEAQRQPQTEQAALKYALKLRETIYEVFFAVAKHQKVEAQQLQFLSEMYILALKNMQFVQHESHFQLAFPEYQINLMLPLWKIAISAGELLLEGDLERVKDCPSGEEGCGWLFYDTSKNNSRRWCSMRGCGNAAKERRRRSRAN